MTIRAPFKPHYGSNQVVTPGAASASVSIDKSDKSVRVVNTGANKGYFRIGAGAQTATVADCPVAAGASLVVEKGDGADTIAHISAAGTTFEIMTGEGGI
jgi:hypothetical protein